MIESREKEKAIEKRKAEMVNERDNNSSDILDAIEEFPGITFDEIMGIVDMEELKAYRTLQCLIRENYIYDDEDTGSYYANY